MPKTPNYFKGRTLVITGAGSGIGRSTAAIFGREGASVVCADIDEHERSGCRARDRGTPAAAASGIHVDVTDRASVQDMVAKSIEIYGQDDLPFNGAGSAIKRAKFLEIDDDLWDRTYDLNVKGTFYAMQETIPHMLERGEGVIAHRGQHCGPNGWARQVTALRFRKGRRGYANHGRGAEFADRGIRVLSISPAIVDTPFQDINEPGMLEDAIRRSPMGRAGQPEEIGELVLFMCSDACTI